MKKLLYVLIFNALIAGAVMASEPALPTGAELVFEDKFERAEIGPNWITQGSWKIESGTLKAGGNSIIVCSKQAGKNIRLEYTIWTTNSAGFDLLTMLEVSPEKIDFKNLIVKMTDKIQVRRGETGNKFVGPADIMFKVGNRHQVVCDKWGKLFRLFVDGNLIVNAIDQTVKEGAFAQDPANMMPLEYIGFYSKAKDAYFDDLRIYRLPGEPPAELLPKEIEPTVQTWFGFNALTSSAPAGITFNDGKSGSAPANCGGFSKWWRNIRQLTDRGRLLRDPGNRPVRIADYPDWVVDPNKVVPKRDKKWPQCKDGLMPHWVADGCVELSGKGKSPDENPSVTHSFSPLPNGLIELELLCVPADSGDRGGFEVALLDGASDQPLLSILTNDKGEFCARTASGELMPLARTITHPRQPGMSAPFYFQSERWYRLRIHFDAASGMWKAYLLQLHLPDYQFVLNPHPSADWFELSKDSLPFMRPAAPQKAASRLVVRPTKSGKLYMDNLYVIGPWNGQTVKGQEAWHPCKELINSAERFRHDPFTLKMFGSRNIENEVPPGSGILTVGREAKKLRAGEYPDILASAKNYNEILVDFALFENHLRMAERAVLYLEQARAGNASDLRKRADRLSADYAAAEKALDKLYRAYTSAYMDGLNQARMKGEFDPAALKFRSAVDLLWKEAAGILEAAKAGVKGRPDVKAAPPLVTFKKGKATRDGKKCFYFPNYGGLPERPYQLDLLGAGSGISLNCAIACTLAKEPSFFDPKRASDYIDSRAPQYPGNQFMVMMQDGVNLMKHLVPSWWLEKNAADDDVFFCDENGKVPLFPNGKRWDESDWKITHLNYWNPKVRDVLRGKTRELAAMINAKYSDRCIGYFLLWEAGDHPPKCSTGYNQSAVSAFREKMKRIYGEIGKLNQRWGSNYASFDEIKPPPDVMFHPRPKPTGLAYEWELFRMEGFRDYNKLIIDTWKEARPDDAIFSGGIAFHPVDSTLIFPLVDYAESHGIELTPGATIFHRWIFNIQRALGKGSGSIYEWYMGCTGETTDLTANRRAVQAEFFLLASGGRSLLTVSTGTGLSGWTQNPPWLDSRVCSTIFNYSAAGTAASIRRLRNLERELLDNPFASARINILESNSSFIQNAHLRSWIERLAAFLEEDGYNYGFLWESLVLDGRQKLEDSDIIFLPAGACLLHELQEKLLAWVKAGGTLIALEAPGVYDPWGQPDGTLLKGTFGTADLGPLPMNEGKRWKAENGKGLLAVFSTHGAMQWFKPMKDLFRERSKRDLYCANGKFRMFLRENQAAKRWYVTALNTNLYEVVEDEIRFRGPGVTVRDVELPGIVIPSRREGEETVFSIRLAPGEGAVLELSR